VRVGSCGLTPCRSCCLSLCTSDLRLPGSVASARDQCRRLSLRARFVQCRRVGARWEVVGDGVVVVCGGKRQEAVRALRCRHAVSSCTVAMSLDVLYMQPIVVSSPLHPRTALCVTCSIPRCWNGRRDRGESSRVKCESEQRVAGLSWSSSSSAAMALRIISRAVAGRVEGLEGVNAIEIEGGGWRGDTGWHQRSMNSY
jgi:hypothetical protein